MISIKLNRKNPGGLKGFSKRLEALAGKEVAVGFPRGGSGLGNPHYKNGASILLVAVANNYGLGVPRRAFMELAAEKIRKLPNWTIFIVIVLSLTFMTCWKPPGASALIWSKKLSPMGTGNPMRLKPSSARRVRTNR